MKPSVIIVDDEPTIQRMYSRAFENSGYEVRLLNDGVGLLGAVLEKAPDAVLLDIMMPIKNGIEVLKTLRENETAKSIPVVVLSAYEDDSLLQQAMELGAKRYLVKSMVEPESVVNVVNEVISQSRPQQQK